MQKLPIIAMTANPYSSDREKALEAGLNEYVSKPVDVNQLTNAPLRWVKPVVQENSTESDQANPDNINLPKEVLAGLNTHAALTRLGGNLELYRRLLLHIRDERSGLLQEIRQAIETGDVVSAHRLAHTLKGLAGTIGADELSELARALEEACSAGDLARAQVSCEKLVQPFEAVISALGSLNAD